MKNGIDHVYTVTNTYGDSLVLSDGAGSWSNPNWRLQLVDPDDSEMNDVDLSGLL